MIEEHEALRKANDKTTNLHREVRLNRATRSLLRLPGGWRVPYDVYINSFRVRRMMVILFVNDQGRVEVEWDDIAQQPGRIGELKQGLLDSSMDLPLSVVLDKVNEQHPEANIETVEPVLDIPEQNKKAALYWRVGIRQGVQRQVVLVSGLSDDNVELTSVTTSQNAARSQWTLGRVTYDDNQLQVDLKDLEGARQEHLRNQWIVWSCIASISQYMEDLKYTGLGTHNVHVEFVDFDPGTRGASFDDPNGIPTITFLRGGGWSGDRSIVLHELGHALWSLLYTRPPRPIRENDGIELNGIQEGFADYVAATLLFNGQDSVSIGQDLDEQVAQEHDLPRPVDGQPKPHRQRRTGIISVISGQIYYGIFASVWLILQSWQSVLSWLHILNQLSMKMLLTTR